MRQQVYQIARGYADRDDADTLRHDPLRKPVCGRLPETGTALASQPTFSRLENAVTRQACYLLAVTLAELYQRERGRAGCPARLLLDLDSTDGPTHGQQEGTAYHAHFRQHMYHPLLTFDSETGPLVTAVLRPGSVAASRGVVVVLARLVPALRAGRSGIPIELRADGGFASPALYTFCEREDGDDTIGLPARRRPTRCCGRSPARSRSRRRRSSHASSARPSACGRRSRPRVGRFLPLRGHFHLEAFQTLQARDRVSHPLVSYVTAPPGCAPWVPPEH